jgi:two-component system chemotaxis sensor kinase CheA
MGLKASIQAAAKAAVLTDAGDLQSLVALGDLLRQLSTDANSEGIAEVARTSAEAAELSEAIVLRQVDDVDAAFRRVIEAVRACDTVIEQASAPAREPADPELLLAWVASCESSLPEIEHLAVTAETRGLTPEAAADIRRRIHTLKGECGVLSLSEAQSLCHDLESLIDASTDHFPTEAVLAVCDWMKTLASALRVDPAAAEPEASAPRSALSALSSSSATSAGSNWTDATIETESSTTLADHSDDASDHEWPSATEGGAASSTDAAANNAPLATSATRTDNAATTSNGNNVDSRNVDSRNVDSSSLDPFAAFAAISPELRVSINLEGADENVGDFALEAREHLANAEAAVLALESGATDPEQVNIVFRAFHTIKGVAGFLNLTRIVEVAHAAEFLLDKVRSNKLALSPEVLELVLASSDMLGQLIAMLSGGEPARERELKMLVYRLEAACEGRFPGVPRLDNASTGGSLHAAAGVSMSAATSATSPAPNSCAASSIATSSTTSSTTSNSTSNATSSPASGPASSVESKPATPITNASNSNASTESATVAEATTTANAAKQHTLAKADQSVKVSTQRMDALVNLVGELVIAQLMVIQDPVVTKLGDQRVQRNLAHLGKIVRDLQETSMSLRMVTLKSTFQKMARLVRDVAAKAGKRIQLEVEGEDVELDRNVVEEIGDPLVHMIRNACDHGIEPASDRVAVGKSETGTLRLRAFHSGGSIVIEVEDDGRGLSRERIIRKCLEKGLIDASRNTDEISDLEVFNYIFLPGFSTAERITDISGRGVGMDVVRRNIEALRGSVEIRSTPGKGSVFSMRLPLTMAIIDGMVVRVGNQRYIVPTLNIEQSFRPTAEQLTKVLERGEMAKVRNALLPIYRLQRVFHLAEGERELEHGLLLVLENGKRRACVFVDEILGQQQVVIKTLGDTQPQIRGVSGGAILGDGRVALIVDVGGLLETAATPLGLAA